MAIPLSEPSAEGPPLAPPPSSADVGVVMALPTEAGFLIDRLQRVRRYKTRSLTVIEGELEGRVLAVIVSGVGLASAKRGAERLLDGHRPRLLVSAGFAGALDPDLNRNDLVVPRSVADLSGETIEIDGDLTGDAPVIRRVGKLLLVDRVITESAEKSRLRHEHGADLIDMETFGVAVAARDRGVPFVSLRVVSDDARSELPPEVARLLNASGSRLVGAALRAIWERPSAAKDFWALHSQANEAADRLAKGLQVLLRGLG